MNPSRSFPFNVRVYGIYIDHGRLLVSDEHIAGKDITKLPGGGLHYGEGLAECIVREMKEETGHEFSVIKHFYTTDFFQESAFHAGHQVISVYYLLKAGEQLTFQISEKPFDYKAIHGAQSFRWVDVDAVDSGTFTLPIDQVVGDLLKQQWQAGALPS